MHNSGFICVFDRDRDNYQVPIALREAGLLAGAVTDYYAPTRAPKLLPAGLASKRHDHLPATDVTRTWGALATQIVARLPVPHSARAHEIGTRLLARRATRMAEKRDAHLYCYHHSIPAAVPPERVLIVFVFHPLHAAYDHVMERLGERAGPARAFLAAEAREQARFERKIDFARPDAFVCASQVTRQSLIRNGVDEGRITVIPYGLPAFDVGANSPDKPAGPPRLLFVGQGNHRKGLHDLLDAWEQVCGQCEATLDLVCYTGERDLLDRAVRLPRVTLHGHLPRERLDRMFELADLFVLPSLLEGFGLVYLEALARGCHVVGTHDTGLPDLPLSESERTLVPAGEPEVLANALLDLIGRAQDGLIDRGSIIAKASGWTQEDFRSAITEHARRVLANRQRLRG